MLSSKPLKCRFVVTGFGPFHGVPVNPTMILVQRLEKELDTLSSTMGVNIIKALILETSAEAVREKLDDIHKDICSDASLAGCHVVFLHLGVNYMGNKFQLENTAYNDATFRVPDERGYQPQKICILQGSTCSKSTKSKGVHQFGKSLRTSLCLKEVCSELEMESNAQPVCISNDPGRFVCNYTYCISLDKCLSSGENKEGDIETKYHSLFVHVPPFKVIPEDDQYVFVLEIIKKIQQQLNQ
jgi:pyroglutamyl-peptidase